ncbi:bile acid:sodium symporter family protein [Flavobacterium tegetincola]|uniref:bile acid:sodium symporter family protein n=1 Tax=Flavobacterium tegetincola TaxID=150172 RepID=UPI0004083F20|nr:bile acid:sodium symporter family protein [Flavobacterium tegetincola]
MLKKIKIEPFVLAIISTVLLAYLIPFFGNKEMVKPILLGVSGVGISLIFFFYGLKLNYTIIKEVLKNWKVHLIVQSATFILFPLIVLLFYPFIRTDTAHTLWLAVFFLAALPSSVSASVVMVAVAKGNVPAAIFNASLSGIIGILITPIWMSYFIQVETMDFDFSEIYFNLITEIIVPLILGILLQRFFGGWAIRHAAKISTFDKSIILLIVFKSFSESFLNGIFSSIGIVDMLLLAMAVILLFWFVYYTLKFICYRLDINREDSIAILFCGSKKSLIHASVMSKIMFAHLPFVGIMLLPVMLFHGFQIVFVSFIAAKKAKEIL